MRMEIPSQKEPTKNSVAGTWAESFDVAIAGGGLVGLASAEALAQAGFRVLALEANPPQVAAQSAYDDRTLVVGAASRHFWQNLGIWPQLAEEAEAITSVHVSQRGRFGSALFRAGELGVEALGHVVEARRLGLALLQRVQENPRITWLSPARLKEFDAKGSGDKAGVRLAFEHRDQQHTAQAGVLLAADGALSPIRARLGLEARAHDYGKTAVICNVSTELAHNGHAFERLTSDGPVAMLPFRGGRCGFVWSMPRQQAESLMGADDLTFLQQAQARFGYRLGRFTRVGKRSSYPLHRIEVPQQVAPGVVLMGNAAHTLSPVSAQGLNLAVRDIAQLVETLKMARSTKRALGDPAVLADYQRARAPDQRATLQYTDDLMRWFAIESFPVPSLRSAAILATGAFPALQARLFRHGSGFRGQVPPLLRPVW